MRNFYDSYREEMKSVAPSKEFVERMKTQIPENAKRNETRRRKAPFTRSSRGSFNPWIGGSIAAGFVVLAGIGILAISLNPSPVDHNFPRSSQAYANEIVLTTPKMAANRLDIAMIVMEEDASGSRTASIMFDFDFTCEGAVGESISYQLEGTDVLMRLNDAASPFDLSQGWVTNFSLESAVSKEGSLESETPAEGSLRIAIPLSGKMKSGGNIEEYYAKALFSATQILKETRLEVSSAGEDGAAQQSVYSFDCAVENWQEVDFKLKHGGLVVVLVKQ